jgi:hypothetical protein
MQREGGNPLNEVDERRKHQRVQINWPVNMVTENGVVEGQTRDISIDGFSVFCDEPLRLHDTFQVTILPPNHELIEITGKMVWSDLYAIGDDDATVGIGVCFVQISEEDRMFFQQLVSELPAC